MRRLMLLLALVAACVPSGVARASEPFAFRGVIEGFYGTPWTHVQATDELAWMGAHGLNAFVHAPKFDPYQRANWRDPYPPGQLADLTDEVRSAAAAGVAWIPNISVGFPLIPGPPAAGAVPSRDVCFACPSDLDAIVAKLAPFHDAGTRTLMVSFDDVQKISTHPEDAIAYGTGDTAYGRMTRDLLNAVAARFPDSTILTVLAEYSGTADTAYLQGVREAPGLAPSVQVMWTGTAVVAATITTADAAAYAGRIGRDKVLIWDNYPVNDYAGGIFDRPQRVFLGPYEGRSSDLDAAVSGVFANPMGLPVLSRVALSTMSDYLAAPASYDAEASWRAALASLDPSGDLGTLAANSRSSTLDRTESADFVDARDAFLGAIDAPFWTDAADALDAVLARAGSAGERLQSSSFAGEVAPWAAALQTDARAGANALDAMRRTRPSLVAVADRTAPGITHVSGSAFVPSIPDAAGALATTVSLEATSVATPQIVFGDRAQQDLGTLYLNQNRMDAFVATVTQHVGAWLPTAGLAASGITVTVGGVPVQVADDGTFSTDVASSASVAVVATDGAGGATGRVV